MKQNNSDKREFLQAIVTGDRVAALNIKKRMESRTKPFLCLNIIAHSGHYEAQGRQFTASQLKAYIREQQEAFSVRYSLLDIDGKTDIDSLGLGSQDALTNGLPVVTGMHIY